MGHIDLGELSEFFAIPLLIQVGCWLIQRQWKMRLNAGTDLFVFLLSLDLTLLIWFDPGALRINPSFTSIYRILFGSLFALAFMLLGFATRVQWKIQEHVEHRAHYPLGGVIICWLFGTADIGFHLYAMLGGAPWSKH